MIESLVNLIVSLVIIALIIVLGGAFIWFIGNDTFSLTYVQSISIMSIAIVILALNDVVDTAFKAVYNR